MDETAELRAIHRTLRSIRFFIGLLFFVAAWLAFGDVLPAVKMMLLAILYIVIYAVWRFSEAFQS